MDLNWDYRDMGRFLRQSPELYGAVNAAAKDIASRARAIAVREAFDEGDYSRSIGVFAERGADGRLGCVVEATDHAAVAIEFGNAATRGRGKHILRRAADGAS